MFSVFVKIKSVLSQRWPEALVLVGFWAATMVLLEEINSLGAVLEKGGEVSQLTVFFMTAGMTAFAVLGQMIELGFLRTAVFDGDERQDIFFLLSLGRHFFWRVLIYRLLSGLLVFAISFIVLVFVNSSLGFEDGGFRGQLAAYAVTLLVSVVAIKFIVVVPAIIVVEDCGVLDAIGRLRGYNIFDYKAYLAGFAFLISLVSGLGFVAGVVEVEGYRIAMLVFYALVGACFTFFVDLFAVYFVGEKLGVGWWTVDESFEADNDGDFEL